MMTASRIIYGLSALIILGSAAYVAVHHGSLGMVVTNTIVGLFVAARAVWGRQ